MEPPDRLLCHFLSSVRTSQLKHERLRHSVDGSEDARGRARDLEERARTGMSRGLRPGTRMFQDRVEGQSVCPCLVR